jgi:hypothetical protein
MADFILPSVGGDFNEWGEILNGTMQNLRDEQTANNTAVAGISAVATTAANDSASALTTAGNAVATASAAQAAAAAAYETVDGLVKAAVPLRGDGVDPTGATDSTAAVQGILNAYAGRAVQVIAGDVIRITSQIQVPDNTALIGPGEIRVTAGIEHTSAIRLGSGSRLVDVKLTNPNQIISGNTGGRSYGVSILGNDVLVQGCLVDGFENGIAVLSGGEWYNHRIIGNRIKDVIGWNSVPSNNGTTGGEDRGDGIVTWGALATIVGNIVNAKSGYDARIGIHAESLKTEDDTPSPADDRMVTVSGNIVYGKFRRGITIEETKQAVVTGNVISDSTWWGISMILGEGHVVTGNTIRWTRTSSDTQGSNYSPTRGPIAILKGSLGTLVQGNTIVHADGSSASGSIMLYSEGVSDQPVDCMILDNNIQCVGTGTVQDGIRSDGLNFTRPVIRGNFVSGFTRYGINMYTVDSPVVESNILRGASATIGYIKQNAGGDFGIFRFNHITGCGTGMSASSSAVNGVIENNYINCATAFFFGGTPTGNRVASNKFGALVTTYQFPNASSNFLFNNLELQGTVTWNPGTLAPGATVSTTCTVTGATAGNSNLVLVGMPDGTSADVQVTGHVQGANTVRIVVTNRGAANATFTSGTWKAQVLGR